MSEMSELEISRQAAEQCARVCSDFAQGIADVHAKVERLAFYGGFGTLPSGVALEKKYSELAVGGPGSLSAMLQAHITVATNLAATFSDIGKDYQATDEAVAQSVTNPPR